MKREFKGHMLGKMPVDYVLLDIKTSGADPYYDSLISIEASHYVEGEKIDDFYELFPIKETEKADMLSYLHKFIGKKPLIGYGISFTIDFLYDTFITYLEIPLANDYIDLKEVVRKTHYFESNYSLNAVYKGVVYSMKKKKKEEVKKATTLEYIAEILDYIRQEVIEDNEVKACRPFEERRCVFTGKMQRMTTREITRLLQESGGIKGTHVTSKTNYLILGNHDYCSNIEDGKNLKQLEAEERKKKGYDIQIISENVFCDLISENQQP